MGWAENLGRFGLQGTVWIEPAVGPIGAESAVALLGNTTVENLDRERDIPS